MQTRIAFLLLLETVNFIFQGCQNQFLFEWTAHLAEASAGAGKKDPFIFLQTDGKGVFCVHPEERYIDVRDKPNPKGDRTEVDQIAPGEKAILCDRCAYLPAPMPSRLPFSEETALFGNCERKSFYPAADDTDREQGQSESILYDQIQGGNVGRNGDGFLRPSAADLFRRTGFEMALYDKLFFIFGVLEQHQDRGVRKMEIMEGLDQVFLFDDRGMRG
jgi:hypothetical protein